MCLRYSSSLEVKRARSEIRSITTCALCVHARDRHFTVTYSQCESIYVEVSSSDEY